MMRHAIRVLSLAALTLTACTGDEDAPDCFFPDGMGGCLIPPIIDIALSCDIPDWAVSAQLAYVPDVTGGTGSCNADGCSGFRFQAMDLPDGLSLDENTGLISGAPTAEGVFDFTLSVTDNDVVGGGDATCQMNVVPALNVDRLRLESKHCLDLGENVVDFLDGGVRDENDLPTDFVCGMRDRDPDPNSSCPFGDGNGVIPNGIAVDYSDSACMHSGSVTEDAYGTWVWMVQLEQHGYTIHVPFCASNDTPQTHLATRTFSNSTGTDYIEPLVVDFVPGVNSMVGSNDGSDPAFTVDSATGGLCTGTGCNFFGFEFAVTCSPLDPPFSLNPGTRTNDAMGNAIGFTHGFSANFPMVSAAFEDRAWVANWSVAYCNADNGPDCLEPLLSSTAQSHYNTPVLGWPQ